jgi:hypothetical protein
LFRRASCQLAIRVTSSEKNTGKLAACPTLNTSPRSRTSSGSFEDCHASVTPARRLRHNTKIAISRPGIEPGPGASETPMRSFTPSGHFFRRMKDEGGRMSRRRGRGPTSFGSSFILPPSSFPRARARGVEPRGAVLEAACSPRSTLVKGPRTAVRGLRETNSPAGRSSTPR